MTTHEAMGARRPASAPEQPARAHRFRPRDAETTPQIDAVNAGLVLLPLRIFLAAGWLRAAAEKVIDAEWWSGDALRKFLDTQRGEQLPYFEPIAEHVIRPFASGVAAIVVLAQIMIGLSLAFGRLLRVALWFGVALNVVFIMVGRVNPSAFYLFMEVALLYGVSVGTLGHMRSRRPLRPLVTVTVLLALAATQIPFIRTIEPAGVVEDPAMMLTFLCLAAMVTTLLRVIRRHTTSSASRRNLDPLWSLLLCRPAWSLKYSSLEPWPAHGSQHLAVMVASDRSAERVGVAPRSHGG